MSLIVGLTGGIGSGKTTIGKFFAQRGVPVYVADDAGKRVSELPEVKAQIVSVFGAAVLAADGSLDRKTLANLVFGNPDALAKLNAIVHPAVKADFESWKMQHKRAPLLIRESAILFESKTHTDCDYVITVSAPENIRIARVVQRDQVSEAAVRERLQNQWTDAQRERESDFIINNLQLADAEKQAAEILKNLSNQQKRY